MAKRLHAGASDNFPARELSAKVLAAFYKTYNALGYGFLESVYKNALAIELRSQGLKVLLEVKEDVFYKGHRVGFYRIDMLVEDILCLELKSTEALSPTDKRQLLNFLKASNMDVGLLLHYGPEPRFHRVVHPKYLSKPPTGM